MSNYIEYNDKIAFHPGYYIKEIVDDSGLTQQDFAKRLGTTPKNLSILINGEQSLSRDMAIKLSQMLGTSISFWLNLQKAYDTLVAEFESNRQLEQDQEILKLLDYPYFRDNFNLPDFRNEKSKKVLELRKLLGVSTLTVLKDRDLSVSFRSECSNITESNLVKANAMVQIAVNQALKCDAPKYDKNKFQEAIQLALTLTDQHEDFYPILKKEFRKAGVIFVILPNLKGSKINGATKRVRENIVLMVNDRRGNSDTFWFTLFHEIGHIMNKDFGLSFENETGEQEEAANKYAQDALIPRDLYNAFVLEKNFDKDSIVNFANQIDRDPAIIVGRLQNDGYVKYSNRELNSLKHKYSVCTA